MDKDKFVPTHRLAGIPVVAVDEGWSGHPVPDLDGVPLPIGIYDREEWEHGFWPTYRASRDGRVAADCQTWVYWKFRKIRSKKS